MFPRAVININKSSNMFPREVININKSSKRFISTEAKQVIFVSVAFLSMPVVFFGVGIVLGGSIYSTFKGADFAVEKINKYLEKK